MNASPPLHTCSFRGLQESPACPRSGHGQGGRVIRGLCARGTDTNTPSSLPSSDAPGGVLSDSKIRRGASVTEINIIGDTVSMEREKLLFYLKKKSLSFRILKHLQLIKSHLIFLLSSILRAVIFI